VQCSQKKKIPDGVSIWHSLTRETILGVRRSPQTARFLEMISGGGFFWEKWWVGVVGHFGGGDFFVWDGEPSMGQGVPSFSFGSFYFGSQNFQKTVVLHVFAARLHAYVCANFFTESQPQWLYCVCVPAFSIMGRTTNYA
jgi:hypothetical protein